MKSRDLEFLSSYLDGQTTPSESARLESRLRSDPELSSALADLRAARNILRKLPTRKAPRNFTLTRKMVGLNPPLPRSYAFFRFSTALASALLILTFAANLVAPRLSYVGPINTGWGGGYGGGPAMPQTSSEMAAATEAPAMEMLAEPTESASEDAAREALPAEAPMGKQPASDNSAPQNQPEARHVALVSVGWQVALLMIGMASAAMWFVLRQSAKRKWR